MITKKVNSPVHHGAADLSEIPKVDDPLGIKAIDYIEIVCGNARQATGYYSNLFGFKPVAYRGPETGYFDAASYLLTEGKVRIVLTTPIRFTSPLNQSLLVHGDTVVDIAFSVENTKAFFNEAVKRGAMPASSPQVWRDSTGEISKASIKAYGDVVHSIVQRGSYKGEFFPGFEPYQKFFAIPESQSDIGFKAIDHVVGNVELGQMERWVEFYERILGFRQLIHFSDKDISTEYSALMSKVVTNGNGKIKLPLNEPAEGKRRSQIEEYLDYHNGPGVHHLALITGDIISTVKELRRRGVSFLKVPKTYYEALPSRVGKINEDLNMLAELGILVDRDDDGYLLQIFTKPVQDRPTMFFEVIQRHGSQGFGVGNFKALFEAIEREQELRGNL